MSAVMFDTLQLARDLRDSGFSEEQATGAARALARGFSSEVATRSDVEGLGTNLRAELVAVRAELKEEIAAVRSELKEEIAAVRSELKEEIAAVRSELKEEIAAVRSELEVFRAEMRGEFASVRAEARSENAALKSSTASWIITAVMINTIALLGVAATLYGLLRASLVPH